MGTGMMFFLMILGIATLAGGAYLAYLLFAPDDGGTNNPANLAAAGGTLPGTNSPSSSSPSTSTTSAPAPPTTSAPTTPAPTRPPPPVTTTAPPATCGNGICPTRQGVWIKGKVKGLSDNTAPRNNWGQSNTANQQECITYAIQWIGILNSNQGNWPAVRAALKSAYGTSNPVSKMYVDYDSSSKQCRWGVICGSGTDSCSSGTSKFTIVNR